VFIIEDGESIKSQDIRLKYLKNFFYNKLLVIK
jgi:hypothetical protein